ncbi:protein-L-isoaspartate O-methyltransferase [Colwellia sp. PAMC 20917]|jgi:protein-L-isoaspartate(D-aspartate) O-methyltransferase|uniref:protein-L-isoaspartate(D-aspartate) O-methyltransferase n=1 Tax=unclassified Colwellia TaxID=196834 RepID=UPI0008783CE0|nr:MULTISPECIES: protein-L-isoaspartate(D-aspartate) O-methyltransferase [unclassified Colwellia]MBA6363353.1 protein-L-isoaspartate(D-aspartate) O-methyltransferase [Colwellia sp. BRX8-8]AOW76415.1 protein-L-isoaspartate O-methyltransferase [Colwellia sp. PAMC 20917]MBA6335613.1 protein-L-isoaspartate(D-aspartate) O-methyltransferase [Colwellia sp. BRX8-7]MBA6349972.1 protein-L-isoaspartate(D-aspartate) O-methyltransferase [Colwellia sp. BRX8-9]MBA6353970.1 protein-L-isoaspartate(D-aspartate)|tara:strand:+ start:1097 stop:1759 length:663 start_codon:yes stop_codon:yes gene_type:complete
MNVRVGSNVSGKSRRSGELLAQKLYAEGIRDQRVLQAIAQSPRHIFVPEILAHKAYDNTALPIGQGQTISQPYIVAKMSELLLADGVPDSILEIGTGSGYQTSILTQLVAKVFSVERIKALQWQAKRRLQSIDLNNVSMKHGDGWQGWSSKSPFQAIIVTAAPTEVPKALLEQLADGGRLVIPVGTDTQILKVITRHGDEYKEQQVEMVKFVPLVPGALI